MDRISALRNVEEALRDFEAGESDLAATEQRVVTILRTYATDFEGEEGLRAYQATGDGRAHGLVVVAESESEARERIADLLGEAPSALDVDISPV
ncbi:DUF7854 family protein [Halobellus limi]|uniref:Uncharacterized protein n=1 Tax=Halobellus limi TaxID=699433 RepID=A0A1H5WAR8_9EURY|nr:hypothetical protein [Halobellus limi]QCC46496.1 hypothetical protein DV707_01715 [Halobellus limi]SEF96564.1 hypothetical protein SAMN04488133_1215 [Halobellus limi]